MSAWQFWILLASLWWNSLPSWVDTNSEVPAYAAIFITVFCITMAIGSIV